MKSAPDPLLFSSAAPDALRAWVRREQAQFDTLEPPAALWDAIAQQLPAAPDALRAWTQQHRAAFDVLEPRATGWAAVERTLHGQPDEQLTDQPRLTAQRGGAGSRPAWWQLAAAAAIVFGLGYGLRAGTEVPLAGDIATAVEVPDAPVLSSADGNLHVATPRHGFRNQKPNPPGQAALLASNIQPAEGPEAATYAAPAPDPRRGAALAPGIARLEARYAALIARQRAAAQHRFVPTHALADEWDREMTVLDSAYAALRQELPRNPRTDDVVAAMNRNLHLRLKLLHQQMMALDAVQEVRHRASQVVPRRPPSVNPDDNGVNLEDAVPGGGTRIPPAPPAPAPLPGLGAHVAPRWPLAV